MAEDSIVILRTRTITHSIGQPGRTGAIAVAVVAIVTMVLVWSITTETGPSVKQAGEPPSAAAAADAGPRAALATSSGDGWSDSYFAGGSGWDQPALVLQWDVQPRLEVIDRSSGVLLGSIELSYRPFALLRPAAQEILVSDRPASTGKTRLLIFDASTLGQLRLKRELPLPDRALYTDYGGQMALSSNQRFLFYPAVSAHCAGETNACDAWSVGIVDLDTSAGSLANLPTGCGWPHLAADSFPDTALATCSSGASFSVAGSTAASAAVLAPSALPRETEKVFGPRAASAEFSVTAPGGRRVTVYSEGSAVIEGPAETPVVVRAVPDGMRLYAAGEVFQVDAARLLIPYGKYLDEVPAGVAVFNVQTKAVERSIPLSSISGIVADGSKSILGLTTDGALVRINIASGDSTPITRPRSPAVPPAWFVLLPAGS